MIHIKSINEVVDNNDDDYYYNLYNSFLELPIISDLIEEIKREYKYIDNYHMRFIHQNISYRLGQIKKLKATSYYDTSIFSGNGFVFYNKDEVTDDTPKSVYHKKSVLCVVKEEIYPGKIEDICYKVYNYNKVWYKFKILSNNISNLVELVVSIYISEDYVDSFFDDSLLIKKSNIEIPNIEIENKVKVDPVENMKKLLVKIKNKK